MSNQQRLSLNLSHNLSNLNNLSRLRSLTFLNS
jgi:hypothetical protein